MKGKICWRDPFGIGCIDSFVSSVLKHNSTQLFNELRERKEEKLFLPTPNTTSTIKQKPKPHNHKKPHFHKFVTLIIIVTSKN